MNTQEVAKVSKLTQVLDSHSIPFGYLLWIFGFTGSHRFYYGKPVSGTIWLFTFGVFGIGWLVDLFLIPSMDKEADLKYSTGRYDYNIAWLLLTFLGVFGAHRLYTGRIVSAIIYFFTGGLFFLGIIYDFWSLNEQVHEANRQGPPLYN